MNKPVSSVTWGRTVSGLEGVAVRNGAWFYVVVKSLSGGTYPISAAEGSFCNEGEGEPWAKGKTKR